MLKNYLKTAWRNFQKNRGFSMINLFGLSVGMAAFMLIALYIIDELSYDRFLTDSDRIYQVNLSGNFGGQEINAGHTPPPVGETMQSEFPGIESYTRVFQPGDVTISCSENGQVDNVFTEPGLLAVDSNFLGIFQFELLYGQAGHALNEPHTIVLTETMARKYFGATDVVGRTLEFGNKKIPCKVSGVLRDIPAQSSLRFDFLVPMQTYEVVKYFNWSWVWVNVATYVKLSPALARNPAGIAKMEAQFPEMVKRHAAKAFARIGMPMDEFYKNGGYWDFSLQPYTRVHLHSAGIYSELLALGSIRNIYIFATVALFIVLLACVNFMNLATARSFSRAKETGIRKVMGSFRQGLIFQFLLESLLMSTVAVCIALLLVALVLPAFNQLAWKQLILPSIFGSNLGWLVVGLTIGCGLFAGSYPAFYLSGFRPVHILKGNSGNIKGNTYLRNGLVVFQFSVSIVLIICTAVVYKQLRYTQEMDMGLEKDNVLVIANTHKLEDREETLRQELEALTGVAGATITTSVPTGGAFGDRYLPESATGENLQANDIALYSFMTDESFIPVMDIKLIQGRNFSKEFSDSFSVILNETAAKQIGWKDPVGQYLQYPGGNYTRFKVVGVTKDFNIQSLHDPVIPFALFHHSSNSNRDPQSYIAVKIKAGNVNNTLSTIQSKWKAFAPGKPLDFNFLDERFNNLYRAEQQMGSIFVTFALLSIVVACLGLLGLSAFAAESRTREIGIRKVLGASVSGIVTLLSKDFVKLVFVAILIGSPIAWWAMNQWLQDFAYRIELQWWMFAAAGLAAMAIALLTVGWQAIRAAVANPVESLRTE